MTQTKTSSTSSTMATASTRSSITKFNKFQNQPKNCFFFNCPRITASISKNIFILNSIKNKFKLLFLRKLRDKIDN
jgi:hypothetical protein